MITKQDGYTVRLASDVIPTLTITSPGEVTQHIIPAQMNNISEQVRRALKAIKRSEETIKKIMTSARVEQCSSMFRDESATPR